jgi:hypothetical protein
MPHCELITLTRSTATMIGNVAIETRRHCNTHRIDLAQHDYGRICPIGQLEERIEQLERIIEDLNSG